MPPKPSKPPQTTLLPPPKPPSLSTHLAIVELKQRILNSLNKLSDRDTHQIAVDDLETTIKTTSSDHISIILNTLYDAISDTTVYKPTVKKEAIRLLSFVCATYTQLTTTHLKKIVAHVVKRLKDSDSSVRDSCCEAIGHLSSLYLKGENGDDNGVGCVVSLFVKPLFEAMSAQNKWVQSGAAMCMAKMVEMSADPPVVAFQKLCGRICKFLKSPNFLANDALLPVVSSLSQVGAISPQFWEPLLQSIHDCLSSVDWSTRKAAADTLNALALHSSNLIREKPTSTITVLEACRFDKIKPVRDSVTEALRLWEFIAGDHEDQKAPSQSHDSEPTKLSKRDLPKLDDKRVLTPVQNGQIKGQTVSEKSTKLKKKGPPLSDKELNPEFFERLSRRVSGEVEVVVNGRSINLPNEEESEVKDNNDTEKSKSKEPDEQVNVQDCRLERGGGGPFSRRREFDDKGNLLGIQRQLLHLERQQARLMNMLQAFKGGSHDGMTTLENRVWGLERVVDDMARNLSVSLNTIRSSYANAFHESSERPFSKYNGFSDYYTHGPNTQMSSRRAVYNRLPKRAAPVRFVEGPSARSVWKASKDEATLEAIRAGRATSNMPAQVPENENIRQNQDNINMAFGKVLSSGNDFSLVKLMDETGPVIDRLSDDVANEVLCAVAQFLLEPSLFDICLSWIQQLLDMIIENGKDFLGIPMELKREILVNFSEASSSVDPPENWEGLMPDQVLLQLALAWDINLQQLQ